MLVCKRKNYVRVLCFLLLENFFRIKKKNNNTIPDIFAVNNKNFPIVYFCCDCFVVFHQPWHYYFFYYCCCYCFNSFYFLFPLKWNKLKSRSVCSSVCLHLTLKYIKKEKITRFFWTINNELILSECEIQSLILFVVFVYSCYCY